MEEIKYNQNDKIISLKKNLDAYGFNEPFNGDNYELINHIINDFNKILYSFKSVKKEKKDLEEKNKILENEIETLKQQINSLLDTNNIKDKLISQVQILSDDKKKLISEINELQQEISDKNKDKHLLELTIEKNKNSMDFLKIENQTYIEKENKYKEKISELLKQNTDIREQKEKYYDLNKNNNKKMEDMEQKVKILEEKNELLQKNLEKIDEEGKNMKQLIKEKNKAVRDGEENNDLLRKDLDLINDKLKEVIKENENIKKINKDLFNNKNELEKELNELKMQMEQLVINKAKIENENKLMNTEIENIKYKNTVNEKKIYVSNCEIQEMDKTIKYLKKNLEQTKMMNDINKKNNSKVFNPGCRTFCSQCGCETGINNNNRTFCNQCGCGTGINNNSSTLCNQCGCVKGINNNNYFTYNGNEIDIQKIIEDNKTLYKSNKELKNQIKNMALNLDLYINENNLATNRINKLENYIKNK